MSTKSTSRFAIIALTAVAPFALAASAFAADPMGSATPTKPAITDSATAGAKVSHDKDATKDKDAAKDKDATKPATAKSGASGSATDRNEGVTGGANVSGKTTGTVTHTDVTPKAATIPAK